MTPNKAPTRSGRKQGDSSGSSVSSERRSIRDEHKRFTRERLLDAAIEVFEKVGFREATIDQIAIPAGANRTTFYLHFGDKIELARALSGRMMALTSSLYTELGRMEDPTCKQVHNWFERFCKVRQQYQVLFEVSHEAQSNDPDIASAGMKFHRSRVLEYFQPLLNRRPAEMKEVLVARIMLLNLMCDRYFFLQQHQKGSVLPLGRALDEIASLWWSSVLGPHAQELVSAPQRTAPRGSGKSA
jgi:AcrR family transcriptional regulator